MRDSLLYAWWPYIAVALLLLVPAWRCSRAAARGADLAALGRASARLYGGSRAWRFSLGLLLLGHAVAFFAPYPLQAWDRSPARLLLLEGAGLALGLAALLGLIDLLRGRRASSLSAVSPTWPAPDLLLLAMGTLAIVSGLVAALLYRWGSAWYAVSLLPYYRSLVRLEPDLSLVLPLPPLVKLHLLAGIATAAVLPFTRVPFALLGPAAGLWRRAAARPASSRWPRAGRVALALLEIALVGSLGLFVLGALRRVGVSQGYAPAQPIAFSHRIHAGDYQVPCLYCHFAAEKSRHAGIPPQGVCMNCHGQLRVASAEVTKLREAVAQRRTISWVKVHNLPDFVYFNHSQHVLGGIACQRCHGPVETMDRVRQAEPLTMGWCLDCHRREGVVPPSWRTASARGGHAATGGMDCSKCHY